MVMEAEQRGADDSSFHACVDRGPKQPAVRRAVSLITYVLSPPSARNSQWNRSSGLVSAVRGRAVYAVYGEGPLLPAARPPLELANSLPSTTDMNEARGSESGYASAGYMWYFR